MFQNNNMIMKKYYLDFFAVFLLLISCDNGVSQSDYDRLRIELTECKAELEECRNTIEELRNTPQVLLSNVQQYLLNNDLDGAKKELIALVEKFGRADESIKAQSLIDEFEKQERAKKEAEERKKALGFKALKESTSVVIDDITLKFNTVNTGQRWIFDRYGREWRYIGAERGEIFVLSNVSILSENKDPKLPPISIYKISEGSLSLIGTMNYRFSKWEDYASYLGNDADYGNDFAHLHYLPIFCAKTFMFRKSLHIIG
jgi:hypothetical protein